MSKNLNQISTNHYRTIIFIILVTMFYVNQCYAQEYHLGTFNILVGKAWANRVENMSNLILYNNFDIFGTQEVSPNKLSDLKKKLKEVYSYFGVGREDGKNKGEYCAIFYKKELFKLIDGNTFWLSNTPNIPSKGWDAMYPRICTWVKLKDLRNNKEIYFFNTHLDHKGKIAKKESCKLLLKKIKEICSSNSNIVLTGDFNLGKDSEEYKLLSESNFIKDSYLNAKYKFAPTGTYNGNSLSKLYTDWIDHILVSKSSNILRYGILNNISFLIGDKAITDVGKINKNESKNTEIKTLFISDHYPVSVFVEFPNTTQIDSTNNTAKNNKESLKDKIFKKIFK